MRTIGYQRTLTTHLYGPLPPKADSATIDVNDDPVEVAVIETERKAKLPEVSRDYAAKFGFEGRLEQLEKDPSLIKEHSWALRVGFKERSEQSERLHAIVLKYLTHPQFGEEFAVMASELNISSCHGPMKVRLQRMLAAEPFDLDAIRAAVRQLERTIVTVRDQELTDVTVELWKRLRDPGNVELPENLGSRTCGALNTLQLAGNRIPDWAMKDLVDFSREFRFSIDTHYQPTFDELRDEIIRDNLPGDGMCGHIWQHLRLMAVLVQRDRHRGIEQLTAWIDGHRATEAAAIVLGTTLKDSKDKVSAVLDAQLDAGKGFWSASQEQAIAEAVAAINPELRKSAWSHTTDRASWTMRRKWAINGIAASDLIAFLQQNGMVEGMTVESLETAFRKRTEPGNRWNGPYRHVTPSPFDLAMQALWDRIDVPDPASYSDGNYEYAWTGACSVVGSELKLDWVASKELRGDPNNHQDSSQTIIRVKIKDQIYGVVFVSHNPDGYYLGNFYPPYRFVEDLNAIAADLEATNRYYLILADGREMPFNPFKEPDNIYLVCMPPLVASTLAGRFGFPILGP